MADNYNLGQAKKAKNDEFYTMYEDIESEMNAYFEFDHDVFRNKTILCPCDDPEWSNFTKYFAANFERFGLKKLISTSYAKGAGNKQPTLFELNSSLYDKTKHDTHGKIFTLTGDTDGSGHVDTDDVVFSGYLEGDGDFRSEEVTKLRDEADIIATNPPFSLFRSFLSWILEANKQFMIIGNMNAITYKEVFPLLKDNKIWLGYNEGGTHKGNSMSFMIPDAYENKYIKTEEGLRLMQTSGKWFTNIDYGNRHKPLQLDTMIHNLKFNKKLKRNLINKFNQDPVNLHYLTYDNYDAIEVPFTECIPSDYDGVMGVPISFMNKYCPEQFEILNANDYRKSSDVPEKSHGLVKDKEASITADHDQRREEKRRVSSRMHESLSNENNILAPGCLNAYVNSRKTYGRIFIRRIS